MTRWDSMFYRVAIKLVIQYTVPQYIHTIQYTVCSTYYTVHSIVQSLSSLTGRQTSRENFENISFEFLGRTRCSLVRCQLGSLCWSPVDSMLVLLDVKTKELIIIYIGWLINWNRQSLPNVNILYGLLIICLHFLTICRLFAKLLVRSYGRWLLAIPT